MNMKQGSLIDMMLEAGFSPDHCERAVLGLTRNDWIGFVLGEEGTRRFEADALARLGRGIWTVDVEWVTDHESLKAGVISDGVHRCRVQAANEYEAELIAAQIVGALGLMPTATALIL